MESILDYYPVNLIHAIPNIIGKMMATRLARDMNQLISVGVPSLNQETFMTTFSVLKTSYKKMEHSNTSNLLVKIDIKKVFDSV